jgi:hypothetical protein
MPTVHHPALIEADMCTGSLGKKRGARYIADMFFSHQSASRLSGRTGNGLGWSTLYLLLLLP